MKKLMALVVISLAFMPAAAHAQTPSECSSIEQKMGEGPVVIGSSPPANVSMSLLENNEFSFVVTANPGYSLDFIQLVYIDSVGTHIVMPGPNAVPPTDIVSGWQTEVSGGFDFYKVSGCQAQQASTTTSTTSLVVTTVLLCHAGEHTTLYGDGNQSCDLNIPVTTVPKKTNNAAIAVVATPAFTG